MKDEAWVQAMQELRRSNAATSVPSGKKYIRKSRTEKTSPTTVETNR